ncbi:MAG: molybdate ABC transporter substrate-binding protein [Thermodesulfobacteriota bacterium]
MSDLRKTVILIVLMLLPSVLVACGKKNTPVVDTQIPAVKIAVVSNFAPTAKLLADDFTANTAIAVEFVSGTNQELVDMIIEGGDYDVFMASDTEHPKELIDSGKALSEGSTVYAFGTVALYSKTWKVNWTAVKYLKSGQFTKLAIANPEENRYGKAAIETMEILEVYPGISSKLVYTEDQSEALGFVETKKADAGFIAYSSLSGRDKRWAWVVPAALYEPIEQGAVLINKSEISDSSKIWMGYLSSDSAKSIIQQSGYGVIDTNPLSSRD